MRETLIKKIKYLLSYKLKIDEKNERYINLLENIFYEFLKNMEEMYNKGLSTSTYFNILLNKLNSNIKSIIIPAEEFFYHSLGFLEFKTDLKDQLAEYKNIGIEISKELKEEVFKKNYFFYLLNVVKKNNQAIGFQEDEKYEFLEFYLNQQQSLTLAKMNKMYKKEYKTTYPDGTKYHYFIYTKYLSSVENLNINLAAMIEAIFDSSLCMQAQIEGNAEFLPAIDKEYDHLLGTFQHDKVNNKVYTTTTIINEFLKRIEKEESLYKKLEYFKKINRFLFEIFDYKITRILNQKDSKKIEKALDAVKVLESSMLYNTDASLHSQMAHVKILKRIKNKFSNYLQNDSDKTANKEYVIYNSDKRKKETVTCSVQPIHVDDKYVLLNITDIKSMSSKVLVKLNISIVDYSNLATKIYGDLYLSAKEIKHLFSSSDLGVFTRESEAIRTTIANRVLNPTIMDIIRSERHNFLGEFIYSDEEERCVIYKNKSIEEALRKVI